MALLRTFLAAAVAGAAPLSPAVAQRVSVSEGPASVSISIYRDPNRSAASALNRRWLNGYALVTETRTVRIPAGPATIRFEGVSSGILAESAIVTGLPADVAEKNLDADLLSPRSLYDRSLGRRVTIRRIDPASGVERSEQAVIRSGADGAAVLETATGFEALRCSGLAETLVYDAVPPGLSAKPTLSIETSSPREQTVTIQLSYLAGGFDWQADYVLTMQPDGSARLFGWLTLASTDVTSYVDAQAQVIAGRLNRTSNYYRRIGAGGGFEAECWASAPLEPVPPPPPPPPPAAMAPPAPAMAERIVVTGARIAKQEDLGDLKLYRVPQPTTVAANAQKQVALMDRTGVRLAVVHMLTVQPGGTIDHVVQLRGRNRAADGLGLPLPAGRVELFEESASRDIRIGQSSFDDIPIDGPIRLTLGPGPGVDASLDITNMASERDDWRATIRNANPFPVSVDLRLNGLAGERQVRSSQRIVREDGWQIIRLTVPANATREVDFSYRGPRP